LAHLVSGALAGATAKTVEAPLDRVKIIFQVSKQRFSLRAAGRQMLAIARSEGVAGLWKGNGARRPAGVRQLNPGWLAALPASLPTRRRHDGARHPLRRHKLRGARSLLAGARPPRARASRASPLASHAAPQWLTPEGAQLEYE
jgi:hypothetical protein